MRVLVVQDNRDLGSVWCKFLERQGLEAVLATSEQQATLALENEHFDVLVLEPVLESGGGLCIADLASFRHPDMPIIAVTKSSFFADGSIFAMIPNACGLLRTPVRPHDLVAYLEHFAPRGSFKPKRMEDEVTSGAA
ncbi:response regulator [Algicella marina]|nr:response regulator [Algicella marina]